MGQKALRRLARVGGIHILAASRADEDAVELDAELHGALTYLVLEGIAGAADRNRDGSISVQEIIGYASAQMPLLSRRLGQGSISQKPVGYSRRRRFCCRRVIEWHRQVSACECGEPEDIPNWVRIIGSTN